uniref:T9SS type A sorting domain-containing protein n=1 Tax=uncultured Chryseobacterium sp. TaxID=259322 RepID=UPI002634E48D
NIDLPDDVKNFSVEITDMLGHSLIKKDNETRINVSQLVKGAYLVTIKSEDQTAIRKILIER